MDPQTTIEPCLEPIEPVSPPLILIVDDDDDQNTALAYCLKGQGFEVATTTSGQAARRLVRELHPTLILLDVQLPDDDGLRICADLDEDPVTAEIPVMIISGAELPHSVRQARMAGGSFYVRKPYDPNALLVLIQHALDQL